MTKEMNKRITSLFLAFTMLFQIFLPQNIFAEGDKSLPQDKYVKVGMIDGKSYDAKIMKELNRIAAKNRKSSPGKPGVRLFSSGPYFGDNNEPKDADKPKYFGNVSAKLDLKGLDGNDFQWNEIFGVDESGNPKPAQIIFRQMDEESSTDTGIEYILQITKGGKYTWSDGEGKPTKLPLFSKSLKPYRYEVRIDERVSDKVKLLTEVIFGTEGSSPTFSPENADGEIIANITLGLTYQQIASTKFKSEWHTDVVEANRPGMKANFAFDDEGDGLSPVSVELPKNDKDTKIIRDWYNEFEPDLVISYYLEKTPDVKIDETTTGLTFEENNGVKTVKSGDHKFKYHFKYDVINGGKLTMTEILPVTFDANGGEFKNFTAPDTKTKIIKEVEYGKDLTGKAENPTKPFETFKGWSTTEKGKTPIMDEDLKNIKEAKTLYAIWDNNKITAEKLTVHESFKADGAAEYTNDFIPTLETLKKQVKIMGADGKPQALADTDTFEILNDSNNAIAGDALKDYLYGKLQEKDNPKDEPTRIETVKAKITHKNGTSQTVDIPIKVIKNIYEAKTLTKKPYYVPADYVMVTVNPTDKAKDPQKTYYYVNKEAQVVIPGQDPTGKGDNKFIKWTYLDNGTETEYKLSEKPRHQFKDATTITAQYVSDVIPQDGPNKPDTVPKNFVSVTFVPTDNGTMDGSKIFWVNPEKEVTIPVTDPKGATYYTFKEWKLGANADGDVYNPSTPKKFTEATTITATYDEAKNIIPYDPTNFNDPKIVRPDGYVRVTFEAETGLKLTENKAYYVKKNAKDAAGEPLTLKAIKDDTTNYGYPKYKEETGYKFDNWDKDNTFEIKEADIVVTAKATKLDNVIPEKDNKGNPNEKPEGYKVVTFELEKVGKEEAGKIHPRQTITYFVKPNTDVTIPEPGIEIYTGYEFLKWTPNIKEKTRFSEDTTVKGSFKKLDDIITAKKSDPIPDGYVTVTFINGHYGTLEGQTIYYVNPKAGIKVGNLTKPKVNPNVGYEFTKKWSHTDTTIIKKSAIIEPDYKALDDVIPQKKTDGTENEKPEGYVTVKLIPTDKATDETKGEKIYFVNSTKEVTIPSTDPVGKKITDVNKNTYTFTFKNWTVTSGKRTPSWNKPETGNTEIKGMFTQDTDITATYNVKAEKIVNGPLAKDGVMTPEGSKVPEAKDLIKNPYDPDHPDSTDKLPEGTIFNYTNDGKPDLSKPGKQTAKVEVKYPNGKTVVVEVPITVEKNVVPQTGTKKPTVPDNYVKVEFVIDPATGGKIADKETKIYYVNPNQKVTIPQPKTKADTGYSFDKWDIDTTTAKKYTAEITTVKGSFTKGNDIIPSINDDGSKNNKPHGYVTVTFDKGAHGKEITGETVYYVNPDAGKKLSDIADKPKVTPDTGFTFAGWDKEDTTEIKTDITVTAQYQSKDDVVPKVNDDGTENKQPEGYITVTFDTTDIGGNEEKVVFVNPNKPVVLKGYEPQGFKVKTGYSFAGWDTSINQAIQYQNGTIIKAVYNDLWKISTTEVQGYAKVEFKSGDHGKLIGVTDYWVKPGEDVYLPAPAVEPNADYRFAGWDKSLTVNLKEGDPIYVIKATYAKIEKPKEPERIVDTRVETRVVEVPVRDRNYRKEVWYMCGFGGDFRPHDGLKRSEAAQILANALREDGYKYDPHYPIAYKDVGKNWYAEAVRITTQANVFVGYPDGYFRPDDKISTVEWIATLRRFQQIAKEDGNHMNLRTGHWATGEIEAAYKAGWLGIYPQGLATFKADTPMPREEVAAVSNRAFNRVMDRDYIRRNDKNMTHYRDVNPSMWSYDDILLASNTFMHDGRFFKAHGITQDNVIFNVNIDGLTVTQDLFQRVKR